MNKKLQRKLAFLNKDIKRKNNNLELLQELHLFLSRGHSINEAVQLMKYNNDLNNFEADLQKGKSIADALKSFNYSDDIILLIRINEQSDRVISGIEDAIDLITIKNNNRNELVGQLRYPLFLMGMIFCVVVFVNNLVLPQILNLYASFGVDIPPMIAVFLLILQIIPTIVIGVIVVSISCLLGFSIIDEEIKQKYIAKIPVIGKEYKLIYNYTFITYMHSLLKSEVSLKEAINILGVQNEHKILKHEARRIDQLLQEGNLFAEILNKRLYLVSTKAIFVTGIKQNNLLMCLETAIIKNRRKQIKKKQRMLFLIQPIIYLVIGCIIIIIYGLIFNICYGLIG